MEEKDCFFDSGIVQSESSSLKLPRVVNESGTRYYWAIKVWDNHGDESEWSDINWFETSLMHALDWQAKWIDPQQHPVPQDPFSIGDLMIGLRAPDRVSKRSAQILKSMGQETPVDAGAIFPCPMIRKEFVLKGTIVKARIYATAHGIYRLELNGKRVGNYEFAPESTSYHRYLQVQTYDVTDILNDGENAVGAVVSDGWWAGRIGNTGSSGQFGSTLGLLMQIEVSYTDGTKEIIGTDDSFLSIQGPWRFADLYIGEKYDANMERKGWSQPNYSDELWMPVSCKEYGYKNLVGQNVPHISITETFKAKSVYDAPNGIIVDIGQVIAGNAKIMLKGKNGQKISLKYTEELLSDGSVYSDSYGDGRNNQHEDFFIFGKEEDVVYEPWFSYRGFRYIWIRGYDGTLTPDDVEARLISSNLELVSEFTCSNVKLNRLYDNIVYTQRSNIMASLTDNPDRERAGWTGDAQMVAPSAIFNMDMLAFWKRWIKELVVEQQEDGSIPVVIPYWPSYKGLTSSTGWGDVITMLPWTVYERTGDVEILEDAYPGMKLWMEYVLKTAAGKNPENLGELTPRRKDNLRYIWNTGFTYGDWLTPSACINMETEEFQYGVIALGEFILHW